MITVLKNIDGEYKDIAVREDNKSCNYRGIDISTGDGISISLPKVLHHTGIVTFVDGSFCIQFVVGTTIKETPLSSYVAEVEIEVL